MRRLILAASVAALGLGAFAAQAGPAAKASGKAAASTALPGAPIPYTELDTPAKASAKTGSAQSPASAGVMGSDAASTNSGADSSTSVNPTTGATMDSASSTSTGTTTGADVSAGAATTSSTGAGATGTAAGAGATSSGAGGAEGGAVEDVPSR